MIEKLAHFFPLSAAHFFFTSPAGFFSAFSVFSVFADAEDVLCWRAWDSGFFSVLRMAERSPKPGTALWAARGVAPGDLRRTDFTRLERFFVAASIAQDFRS